MAETEVFKLDLDTTALEQKAARVDQLVAQIKQGKGRGEDVSELERSLNKELDGLAQLGRAEKKAAGSTEDLFKQKEKLGAVVRTLGGSFSGLVGDLGGVVELLLQAGPAGAAAAAVFGGFTAVVGVFRSMNEELKRAIELTKKLEAAQSEFTQQQVDPIEQITATLKRFGAFSQKNLEGAFDLYVGTLAEGVGEQRAAELAGVGFLAEQHPKTLAMMAAAGMSPETSEEAEKQIAELLSDPKVKAEIEDAVQRNKYSREGAQSHWEAAGIRTRMAMDPRFFEKLAGVSQDAILLERAKEHGLMKPGAGVERIDELRKEYEEIQQALYEFRQKSVWTVTPWAAIEATTLAERAKAIRPLFTYGKRLTAAGFPDTTGPRASAH